MQVDHSGLIWRHCYYQWLPNLCPYMLLKASPVLNAERLIQVSSVCTQVQGIAVVAEVLRARSRCNLC